MSQQANITVFDGASTPVSHSLITDGVSREGDLVTASWKESLSGVPDYAQVRFWQLRQKLRSGVTKVTNRVDVPIMESVSGVNAQGYTAPPKIANVERAEFLVYAHPRSVETNRRLCQQILINLLSNVSTTVTPAQTGPVCELNQKLVIVS